MGTEDNLSKVNIQMTNLEMEKKGVYNQVEILANEKEVYNRRLDQLEPLMETFESKIMCMENKLKNEIDELTIKSTQSKKEIQSYNDTFEDKINKTKNELKIVKNEISQ